MQEKAGDIANACRLLGVSRSGYYAARQRALAAPRLCPVSVKLQAAFARSGRSYGSRRLLKALRAKGLQIGRHRVRRLMREHQLRTVWRRKFVHTTDSRHGLPVAPNVLDRQFDPVMPNRAWVTDITYVRTRSGWLYLAAVMDLFSRKIVGWAMAPSIPAELVCSALQMAITQRQPPAGLIVHSDRGSQFRSRRFLKALKRHGLTGSMGRVGACGDNAAMESFFALLQKNVLDRGGWATRQQLRLAIVHWIEATYHRKRRQRRLGKLTPVEFECIMIEAVELAA